MLTYIYKRALNVSPFFIVPIALTNDEAVIALGPQLLSTQTSALIRQLYNKIAEEQINSPVIAQFFPFDGKIIIANTIQTQVPDTQSGRHGLKLTYGAIIKKPVFLTHDSVCSRIFNLFNIYFSTEYGASTSMKGAERIVKLFQQTSDEAENIINEKMADKFLDEFESEFYTTEKAGLSLLNVAGLRNRTLLRQKRFRSAPTVEEAADFWSDIDESISSHHHQKLIPKGNGRRVRSPVIWLTVGTIISLVLSIGFIEVFARNARIGSFWQGLFLIVLLLFSFVAPTILIVYALYKSFFHRPRKQILLTIIMSYLSLIFVFAGIYYSMQGLSEYNHSVLEYIHYKYEGDFLKGGLALRVRPYSEDHRAIKGIGDSLWSSVKDIDNLFEVYRDPDPSLEKYWTRNAQKPMDTVIRFRPEARLTVFGDCLHFSVMTMATVGYGDITPRSWYAKLATDLQALSGIALFIIALGMFFGNSPKEQ